MIERARRERPRPRSLRSGALFVSATLAAVAALAVLALVAGCSVALASPLVAQEPDTLGVPPLEPQAPDTVPRPLTADTLEQDTAATDTLVPPAQLPRLPDPGPVGWAAGVWRFDRLDLLRLPDISLLDLLERIPGVAPLRTGPAGQAETASILGSTAGAIRYVVDGFALDPLTTPTFDASRIPLLALESVTVERRVTGATVRLVSMSPTDPRTQSIIEAGTGDYDINLFRGMFLSPSVLGGPFAAGFERLAADLPARPGASNHTSGWLKWTFIRDSAGVQLEYRQSSLDRSGVGAPFSSERRDWALRARARLFGVAGEVYGGASTVEDEDGALVLREGTPQLGLRLATTLGVPFPLELRGALRARSHPRLPAREAELEAWLRPAPWVAVGGHALQGWWSGGAATGRWSASALLSPLPWLTAFAEAYRGAPPLAPGDPELRVVAGDDATLFTLSRDGYRAGAELAVGGLRLGGALLRSSADSVAGSGLAFDSLAARFPAGEATGFEVIARIPTPLDPVRLEGWYVDMDAPASWIYLPHRQWRAGLVYHHVPLESGNLEIYARLEHEYRGWMSVPAPDGMLASVPPFRSSDLELTIRVLTVRAFLRWENLLHRLGQRDIPGYFLPGQRVLYGVKWEFFN